MAYTFKGGVKLPERKKAAGRAIETMPAPGRLYFPLYAGGGCLAAVKAGDSVKRAQLIGEPEDELGCPVYSSVSGVVEKIENRRGVDTVIIENDGNNTVFPGFSPYEGKLSCLTAEDIASRARSAGICEGSLPLFIKIKNAEKKVSRLIVNCAESEPYLCAVHRLLLENPEAVINGAKILLKALGLRLAEIATEDNKLDAVKALSAAAGKSEVIRIRVLRSRYPQEDEAPLIYALTGREAAGRSALEMGYAVFSAYECAALFYAFFTGQPSLDRVVTVDGDCVAEPRNLLVSLGSPALDVINYCGGLIKEPEALIAGGPMRGRTLESPDAPITQDIPALLAFSAKMTGAEPPALRIPYRQREKGSAESVKQDEKASCIRCGRCVKVCPVGLRPYIIAGCAEKGGWQRAKDLRAQLCTGCGACSYVCPARVRVASQIDKAKEYINSQTDKTGEYTKQTEEEAAK